MTIRVVFGEDSYLTREAESPGAIGLRPTAGEAILRVLEDGEDIDVVATCSDYESLRLAAGRLGIFPRWLVVTGYLAALVLILNVSYAELLILVFPVWVAAVSVVILRADQRVARAGESGARPAL